MRLFVLDRKGGRKWDLIAPGATLSLVDDGALVPAPSAGDVLIFHEERGPLETLARSIAASGVWVVAVGLGGGDGAATHGYYRRRRSVANQTVDNHFKTCFEHFVRQLQATGLPTWELLEGPPPPDALVAYHLLGLLGDDAAAREERARLRAMALDEAGTIAAARGEAGLAEADLDNREKLRQFLTTRA